MRKLKSYNRIPSFWFRFAIYAAAFAISAVAIVKAGIPALAKATNAMLIPLLGRSTFRALANIGAIPEAYFAGIIIAIGLAAAATYIDINKFHNGTWLGEKASPSTIHGSARLLSKPSDLKAAFDIWRPDKPTPQGLPIGGIGSNHDLLLVKDITHALVVGGTGGGKTVSVNEPLIANAIDSGASIIVLDPKGELEADTGAYARTHAKHVYCIDFANPPCSDSWNPLGTSIDCARGANGRSPASMPAEIRITAQTLIPDSKGSAPIWAQAARILYSGLASFVSESDLVPDDCRNLATVADMASMPREDLLDIVDALPESSAAKRLLAAVVNAPDETYGGFRMNLNASLEVYADPSVSCMLAQSDFDIASVGHEQTVVYVRFNSSNKAYDALVASFVSQAMDVLRREAESMPERALPVRVMWLLEELPQLPKLPNLQKDLAVIRSANMGAVLVAQDRSQIEATYGDDAPAIFNNTSTTVFLSGSDAKTCRYYSELLGSYTVETVTTTNSKSPQGNSSGKSVGYHEAKLLRPEDLAKWDWSIGHLVIDRGQAYACSSIPVWNSFVGDKLGMERQKPRGSLAPARPAKNAEPAKVWHWSERRGEAVLQVAAAIDAMADPRFL